MLHSPYTRVAYVFDHGVCSLGRDAGPRTYGPLGVQSLRHARFPLPLNGCCRSTTITPEWNRSAHRLQGVILARTSAAPTSRRPTGRMPRACEPLCGRYRDLCPTALRRNGTAAAFYARCWTPRTTIRTAAVQPPTGSAPSARGFLVGDHRFVFRAMHLCRLLRSASRVPPV